MSRLSERLRELSESRGLTQAQIADRASDLGFSLGKGAISRYFNGKHGENPSNGTLTAFARVLDVPVSDLKDAAAFTGREPFTPDPSSDRLTAPQRAAVNEVIRQLAEANAKAGDGSERSATPTKQVGVSPATKAGPTADELEELRRRQEEADETPIEDILGLAADHADSGETEDERRRREDDD